MSGADGRVALVTASSKGIGAACAEELTRRGATVAMVARGEESLRESRERIAERTGNKPHTFAADLLSAQEVGEVVAAVRDQLGPITWLVANSPPPRPGDYEKVGAREADWRHAYESVLLSTVRLVNAVLDDMVARGGGSVVGIQSTSIARPIAGLTLSNALRPGVEGLFRDLARHYGPHGVRFNLVLPGRIATDRLLEVERAAAGSEEALRRRLEASAAALPLRRFGQPAEVAGAVAFLLSDDAAYVTGATLPVDGGKLATG